MKSYLLEMLRKEYPVGAQVELVQMDDPYNTKLVPGCTGTARITVHTKYQQSHYNQRIVYAWRDFKTD